MRNIDNLVEIIYNTVMSHKLDEGKYARWLVNDEAETRNLNSSEYGCADAANILYTIGRFETDDAKRKAAVKELQSFQNPESGLFSEPTHHPFHSTAHCTGALQLFDAKPLYPLYALEEYRTKEGLYRLLEGLKWKTSPWNNSHQGAGIFAAFVNTDTAPLEWQEWYFDWLWNEADDKTGLWRKGYLEGGAPLYHSMGGSFHYLFNHEHARRPLRYPDKLIDTMIYLYTNDEIDYNPETASPSRFGKRIGFLEIDWVYCLTRAMRQTKHRYDEAKEILMDFADKYIDFLEKDSTRERDDFNDLHMLFGAVCCVAELQSALAGYIVSAKPLQLVLDRRPFI